MSDIAFSRAANLLDEYYTRLENESKGDKKGTNVEFIAIKMQTATGL
jgi:hypothetical protein